MKRLLLGGLAAALCLSCASAPESADSFRSYPACVDQMTGGRVLSDVGVVVGEKDGPRGKLYLFNSHYWGEVIEVPKVNRFCSAARAGAAEGMSAANPHQPPPIEQGGSHDP